MIIYRFHFFATELSNKKMYVLQTGESLYYKLGQLCFIINQGTRCYKLGSYHKLWQNLLQIRAGITN